MAGYSGAAQKGSAPAGTPLIKKLGIKEDSRVLFINEPASFIRDLGNLPKGVLPEQKIAGKYDYIHYFAFSKVELEAFFKVVRKYLKKDGMLWISWGRLSPGEAARLRSASWRRDSGGNVQIKSDLNENIIREIGLSRGLVDAKVAAIDETWSGLKFVYRLKDR